MKFYLGILFLLTTCLAALPTATAQACNNAGITKQEKPVLQENAEHCAPADDHCLDSHPGQDCPPDTDGCGHCHCSACGTTAVPAAGFFKNIFAGISIPTWSPDDRSANFSYRAPLTSAHTTTLFQPPRV